jgi:hypothetical protein
MDSMVTLTAERSHLYSGALLAIDEPLASGIAEAVVIFGDGSVSEATLSVDDSREHVLTLQPYETAAGTSVSAKSWLLRVVTASQLTVTSGL